MNLFVDDIRQAPPGWTLAKTITQAQEILSNFHVEAVSLDHDIAYFDHMGMFTGKLHNENFSAVANFIAVMSEETRPKAVYVHTANPEGARKIIGILHGKVKVIVRDYTFAHEWQNRERQIHEEV